MKKLIITIIAIFFCIIEIQSQSIYDTVTVSGYVTNLSGAPISNHPVYIYSDTSNTQFTYYGVAYTSSNGYYVDSIFIPSPYAGTTITFVVYTYDCAYNMQYVQISTSTMLVNFTICDSIPASCDAFFYHTLDSSGNNNIAFYGSSTGNVTSWVWNFGDGTSGTGQSPIHQYVNTGTYSVCLTVSEINSNGTTICTDTYCDTIIVGNPPIFCQAYFYENIDTLNNDVQFYDYSTGNITSWYWDFGDGDSSSLQNPFHNYTGIGTYWVCLTVFEEDSSSGYVICSNTYCDSVYVGTSPYPTGGCQANFYWSSDSTTNLIYFNDYSSGSNIISWSWNFGDGNTSTLQNPVHIFANNGIYNVCLTIASDSGGATCTSTYCNNVYVYNNPNNPCNMYVTASIINESSTGASDGAINITVIGGAPLFTYSWSNGAVTQDISGLSAGFYYLTVTDSANCQTFASFDVLNNSDSIYWNYNDTLISNIVDTCYNFIPASASIYSFSYPNNSTISVTWIVFDITGLQNGFVTLNYSIDSSGYYTALLSIECDTVKTIFNFYGQIHIDNPFAGINTEDIQDENIALYPNPVTDKLNIAFDIPEASEYTVNILNSVGQVILTKNVLSERENKIITVNTSDLAQGLYFVNIKYDEKNLMRKFIK